MGIFHNTNTRSTDEEEGDESAAYRNLHNREYRSRGEYSSLKTLLVLSFTSIYNATKGLLLQKVCLFFNFFRPPRTTAEDPLLPIQNQASNQPLLVSSPLLSSPTADSILEKTFQSLNDLSCIDDDCHVSCSQDREIISDQEEEVEEEKEEEEDVEVQEVKNIVAVTTNVNDEERKIKHYSSHHKILLVGEGDFSFSACLAIAFGSAANIIATSLNSKAFLKKNYGKAMTNIAELRSRGSKVMHGIDATDIANHESLRHLKFDRIIFNFPHAGFFRNISSECQLRHHRRLVSKFLQNAKEMISERGEIHVSHKTNGFHAKFKLESIASSHGLRLIQAVKFKSDHYPGYNTKYGYGGDGNFNCNPSKTFKFGHKTAPL